MVKMKRQKIHAHKKKKDAPRPAKKRNTKGILKFILWTLVLAGVGAGVVAFQYMFADSDCFNVKGLDVRLYDENNVLRKAGFGDIGEKDVMGANIFLVDLNDFKDRIEAKHPELRDIVVRRALPNRLVVQARKRVPVAQIYGDRLYLIDKNGIFLTETKTNGDDIPLISGLKASPKRPHLAQKENIDKALFLIRAVSENKKLSAYKIKKIDMADSRNISFFLNAHDAEKVEIKMGGGDFTKRLDVLATVLEQLGRDIERVKYIDLRFEDPIVGPR